MQSLATARLLLRPWREADKAPFAALNNDPRVYATLAGPMSREDSDALADRIVADLSADGWGRWAVEVPGVADFIGFTGLARPRFEAHFTPCIEIGWRLAYEHWGHGYVTEAARAVLDFAFDTLQFPEIVSFTAVGNVRSRAVMERLGFTHDARDDFDHPMLAADHPLRRHVLYRKRCGE